MANTSRRRAHHSRRRMSPNPKGSTPGLLPHNNSIDRSLHPTTSPQTSGAAQPPCASSPLAACSPQAEHARDEDPESGPHYPNNAGEKDQVTYPEGGLEAWLVVLGSFLGMTASFGYMNTIGIYEAYLNTNQLSSYEQSTTGWVFSLYIFLSFFCGVQIGPIFDAKGPRLLVLSGSVLLLLSIFLMGVCTGESLHRAVSL